MNMLKKAAVALAAMSMVASPVVASAAPAVDVRALSAVEDSNELVGTTAWVLAAIALGLVVWGVIELGDDSGSP